MKNRENNYDLLRLISCIGVILIHTSSPYRNDLIIDGFYSGVSAIEAIGILAYNVLPRFSVACFFMISGAFLLSDTRNKDLKYFFKKAFSNTLFPALLFYLGYFIISIAESALSISKNGSSFYLVFLNVVNLFSGIPSKHLWTLTILFIIYLFVPIIIRIKERISEISFIKLSIIYFVICLLSAHTSFYTFYWSPGIVLNYLGYFLIGYTIKQSVKNKKTYKWIISLIISIICLLFTLKLQYNHTLLAIEEIAEKYQIIDPFSPLVCLSSIFMFYAFANMNININVHKISKYSFIIYLSHLGFIKIIFLIGQKITLYPWQPLYAIPTISIYALILSTLFSIIFNKVYQILRVKFYIGDKLFIKLLPIINKIENFNELIFNK